jgi:distribution and morphology protein 31
VTSEDVDAVAMKVQMRLNNLRAAVPLTPPELGFLNAALVRPVVAYMNTNYTQIPFDFTVVLDKQNFDGAWSPYEAKLFDAISIGVVRMI